MLKLTTGIDADEIEVPIRAGRGMAVDW